MNRISLRSMFALVGVIALVICFRHQLVRYLVFDLAGIFTALGMLIFSIVIPIHSVPLRKSIAWTIAFTFALVSVTAIWCLMRCFAFADMTYPREFPHPDCLVETARHMFGWDGDQPNPQAFDGTTTLFLLAALLSWMAGCFFVRAGLNPPNAG
ncbi:hypothetical protein [Mariniblastus fucicola]|nr:hypothetical protein [Mariniblastus fucicola]